MEPDLKPVEPILLPGVRKVIAYFHDECCFHALDYKMTTCSKGDAWWDTEQLMKQMDHAIEIHNAIHPDATALFIFDQSSAHASLSPDALHAWEMNMSDGGKQKMRKDTIIPALNLYPEHCGKVQRMMTATGQVKGMKTVLMEMCAKCSLVCPVENERCCMARLLSHQDDFKNQESMLERKIQDASHKCIFLPKFHCELNPIEMYWRWCKYHYHQIPKKTFKESKELAKKYLDACPVKTIQQFINRSWWFMSAYGRGLTGGAAEWAVT
ncbi:hypothetical protein ARMGADRAFT_1048997 [Armillaria gallica]|uniref:Tc1-like transposase DDE domain-containing protein n=1 Tax=Armillaria gallica TaxID=47427 RepID=A0A2H3CBE5_ARMGA|nr:hypothetical protein ARMGADRAFT_1048997 [Armillaria gallica]